MSDPTRALVLDIDGVLSPVHGHTAWGDDTVAGNVFGPVLVSPTLCGHLDELATTPGLTVVWLSSWTPPMRERMHPFPGRHWPDLAPLADTSSAQPGWWKWDALQTWLDHHPHITTLAWCDDDLTDERLLYCTDTPTPLTDHEPGPLTPAAVEDALTRRGFTPLLIAPHTDTGLTPTHLAGIRRHLQPAEER